VQERFSASGVRGLVVSIGSSVNGTSDDIVASLATNYPTPLPLADILEAGTTFVSDSTNVLALNFSATKVAYSGSLLSFLYPITGTGLVSGSAQLVAVAVLKSGSLCTTDDVPICNTESTGSYEQSRYEVDVTVKSGSSNYFGEFVGDTTLPLSSAAPKGCLASTVTLSFTSAGMLQSSGPPSLDWLTFPSAAFVTQPIPITIANAGLISYTVTLTGAAAGAYDFFS